MCIRVLKIHSFFFRNDINCHWICIYMFCIYGARKSSSSAPNMTMHRLYTTAKSFEHNVPQPYTHTHSWIGCVFCLVFSRGSAYFYQKFVFIYMCVWLNVFFSLFSVCHWRSVMMRFHHLPLGSFDSTFFSVVIVNGCVGVYASFIKIDPQSQHFYST